MRKQGPVTYEELQESLDLPQKTMQAVIRGLLDNGVVDSWLDSEGNRKYDTTEQ